MITESIKEPEINVYFIIKMDVLSPSDHGILMNLLNKEERMRYISGTNIGNFIYDLPNSDIIYDNLSYQGQRKLLMSMDVDKKMSFVTRFRAPVIFKNLSLVKLSNLFEEVQSRVHVHRPHSITFKDQSIMFTLFDYQSTITIYETPTNYVIKETSSSNMVYKTLEDNMKYRIPKDHIRIMETVNEVYQYIANLDQSFLITYGRLKTQLLFYMQYN